MTEFKFYVTNMHCAACSKVITMMLMDGPGVEDVAVDAASGLVTVKADQPLSLEQVKGLLAAGSYTVKEA
jgi:copper chaperone CopZ